MSKRLKRIVAEPESDFMKRLKAVCGSPAAAKSAQVQGPRPSLDISVGSPRRNLTGTAVPCLVLPGESLVTVTVHRLATVAEWRLGV